MPLLRRKPFQLKPLPPNFDPEKEYFVCKATGEVFENYEEFFERVIVCNSLVWSCSITQRPQLTYTEAVEHEQNALKTLKQFPKALRKPVLYLATHTHRTRINDLNDDIYTYIKDIYFHEEMVEAIHEEEWWEGQVIGSYLVKKEPRLTNGEIVDGEEGATEGADDEEQAEDEPDWENIRYRVRLWDDDTNKFIEGEDGVIVVDTSCIRRAKSILNQEKCRLFLKYHSHILDTVWRVKTEFVEKHKLRDHKLTDFIHQREPKFQITMAPQKREKNSKSNKKSIESLERKIAEEKRKLERIREKMEKQRSKEDKLKSKKQAKEKVPKMSAEEKAVLRAAERERMREAQAKLREEKAKQQAEERAKNREQREQERLKAREEKRLAVQRERERCRIREDLHCDDLKPFPATSAVPSSLSHCFGEAVMVLEFLATFGEALGFDETLPDGLTIETLQHALLESDINGPLTDILKAFLVAIFSCQEEEEAEITETQIQATKDADDMDIGTEPTYQELISSATASSQFTQVTHGKSLPEVSIDGTTITEVLRLHLLASGAKPSQASVKFRYQSRGGYTSLDDAGIDLKKDHSNILKALSYENVFDLSVRDKLTIISTLINQLLSYASLRDLLEENMECLRLKTHELRVLQWGEQRREREEGQYRQKRRLEAKLMQQAVIESKSDESKNSTEERNDVKPDVKPDIKPDDPKEQERAKDARKLAKRLLADTTVLDPSRIPQDTGRSRRKVDIAADVNWTEYDLTDWTSLEERYLTEEERETLHQRRVEIDARHKQYYKEREAEITEELMALQAKVGTQNLGKDRWGRVYWAFSSIPGLYVEADQNELVTVEELNVSNHSEKENLPVHRDLMAIKAGLHPSSSQSSLVRNESELSLVDSNKVYENTDLTADPSYVKDARWVYYSSQESCDEVLSSLNSRGIRESSLKQKIISLSKYIERNITSITDFQLSEHSVDAGALPKAVAGTNIKSRSRIRRGLVENTSAHEQLELNLREMLLDIEERICVGGLGLLKIPDRLKWRGEIEGGSYNPQDADLAALFPLIDSDVDEDEGNAIVVRDLSRALLQIQRSIEPKYLCIPLGEAEPDKGTKKKKQMKTSASNTDLTSQANQKTILDRWVDSLLASTSLSQVFLHIITLEGSVLWTKSALNARCKLCRKKGDGEKMLLCDACDRGHHMYCLKPPVKDVPRGDWFCPECRPKQPRSRRASQARKVYYDELETEESQSDDTPSTPAGNSVYDDETQSSSDEELKHPKIKLLKGKGSKKRSRTATPDLDRSRRSAAPSPEAVPSRRSRGSRNNSPQIDLSSNGSKKKRSSRGSSPEAKHRSSGGVRSNLYDDVTKMALVEQVIREIMDEEEAWPFLKPVNRREVPDYYMHIKCPMDLQTISSKIRSVRYTDFAEMVQDVRLIFKNCFTYNMEDCEVYRAGKNLQKAFEKRLKSLQLERAEPPTKKSRKN